MSWFPDFPKISLLRWHCTSYSSDTTPASNLTCPACGYLCLGNGGFGCVDKPSAVKAEQARIGRSDQ